MTKINKNRNLNSTGLTLNISKSKSKNEDQLKNTNKDNLIGKIGRAIKQLKIVSNDIKKSPPVNKLDMTKKISDPSSNLIKTVPKPLPKPPSKNPAVVSSDNSVAKKIKPLPDTTIKSKPLPAMPSRKMQPTPAEIPKLDLGAIFSQMALFENAVKNNSDQINDLVSELNEVYKGGKVTNTTCERFARSGMLVGGNVTRLKAPIRNDIKLFASAWMKMISSNEVIKDEPWYEGVTAVSHEIVEHWD
jgi:hypothetical protein